MCTNASAPDFFFDTPGKPYAALDIDLERYFREVCDIS